MNIFHEGGRKTLVIAGASEPYIRKGDVIGCMLDLSIPIISFTFNGMRVPGSFRNFNLDGMFFPVMSCSSKLRLVPSALDNSIKKCTIQKLNYFLKLWSFNVTLSLQLSVPTWWRSRTPQVCSP